TYGTRAQNLRVAGATWRGRVTWLPLSNAGGGVMAVRYAALVLFLALAACAESASTARNHQVNPTGRQPVTITAGPVRTGPAAAPLTKGRAGEHKTVFHRR